MQCTSHNKHMLAICLLLLAACSRGEAAYRPADSSSAATISHMLAAGTLVDAAIIDTISLRQGHAGDLFTARVVDDVLSAGGRVAIPSGSLVHGTIIAVTPAPDTTSTGTLTLAVSGVTVGGATYTIDASIDSLETTHKGRGMERVDAARVAGGAAAGAILGRVIGGDSTGAIIGGGGGGAAGTTVSGAMKDMDIVLPAGAHLMLTLRQRLTIMPERT